MILIINIGSTSLKYQVYDNQSGQILCKSSIEIVSEPDWTILWYEVLASLEANKIELSAINRVLHRVVFGPIEVLQSQDNNQFRVTNQLLNRLGQTYDFAPLHNPRSLGLIRFITNLDLNLEQYAVFDNYLYRNILPENYQYAVPSNWTTNYGIRRYGYHGLAHLSMYQQVVNSSKRQSPKVLSIQLGGGCSITAFDNMGNAIINSMGCSTGDGLIMSTRSGDIDSGAILHLVTDIDIETLRYDVQNRGGLLALAGDRYKGDMRLILANQSDPKCKLALKMFIERIVGCIGNYWLRFRGFDIITFGGGIGEGSDVVRGLIIDKLSLLGVYLESESNHRANELLFAIRISDTTSQAEVWVVPVDEVAVM